MRRYDMLIRKIQDEGMHREVQISFNPDERGDNLLMILLFNFMLSQPNAFVDTDKGLEQIYHDCIVGMTQMDKPD